MGSADKNDPEALHGEWELTERILQGDSTRKSDEESTRDKAVVKSQYDALNELLDGQIFGRYAFFLNWGYVPNENPSVAVVTPGEGDFDVNSRRLVLEVIGDAPVNDHDVLDVSCGRGSVAMVLHDYFSPRSYTGIDLSAQGVEFCRKHHVYDNYSFLEGDAENLPVDAESFDVLTNIEASHNYPQVHRFFDECGRVLRAGGWFLYTDLLATVAFDRHIDMLLERGFTMERDIDISSNVTLSCDEMGAKRMKIYKDPEERKFMEDFLGLPGSRTYNGLQDGSLQYRLLAFRKNAGE